MGGQSREDHRQGCQGIAGIASGIGSGGSVDFSADDLASDVVFGAVGVQRDFRPVENAQPLGLVGMEPFKQAVERGEAGFSLEDAVVAGFEGGPAARIRHGAIGFEIGVEPPDQRANLFLGGPCRFGEGVELMRFAPK